MVPPATPGSDLLRLEQFIELMWPIATRTGELDTLDRLCHAAAVLLAQEGAAIGLFSGEGSYRVVSYFSTGREHPDHSPDAASLDVIGRVADGTDPFRVLQMGPLTVLLVPVRGSSRGCVHLVRRGGQFPADMLTVARFLGAIAGLVLDVAGSQLQPSPASVINEVAHDLRAPLNVLTGYAGLLREGAFGPLSAEQEDVAATLEEEAQRLLELVGAVLELTRLDPREVARSIQPSPLRRLVEDLTTARGARPCTFTVDLEAPDCLPPVHTAPEVLRLALQQILVHTAGLSGRKPSGVWTAHADPQRRMVAIRIPCGPRPAARSAPLILAAAFLKAVGGEIEAAADHLVVRLPTHAPKRGRA